MAILAQDSFNRTNSTTGLGVATSGQSWQSLAGVWGISSNQAYWISGNPAIAVVESEQANVAITLENITTSNNAPSGAIAFRATDTNNYWLLRFLNLKLQMYKFINGTATLIGEKAYELKIGTNIFKVIANDSLIECYVDGTLQLSTTDTFNQTATKHGLRHHITTIARFDNFLVESLIYEESPGEDGSTSVDTKQFMYHDSSTSSDTKQIAYSDSSFATDLRQLLYADQSQATDTRIAIYQDGATTQDTAQVLYEMSSVAFDTLQELFNDGQVGATPFDVRVRLYEDSSALLDTKQAVYDGGLLRYDLAQVIYESNTTVADVKAVIYADSALQADALQSIYADGDFNADTLQRILAEFSEYSEVVRIMLEITQRRRAPLSIAQSHSDTLEIVLRKTIELNL